MLAIIETAIFLKLVPGLTSFHSLVAEKLKKRVCVSAGNVLLVEPTSKIGFQNFQLNLLNMII